MVKVHGFRIREITFWPGFPIVCTMVSDLISQIMISPSSDPDTTQFPSGESFPQLTGLVCPLKVLRHFLAFKSHSLTFESPDPVSKRCWSSSQFPGSMNLTSVRCPPNLLNFWASSRSQLRMVPETVPAMTILVLLLNLMQVMSLEAPSKDSFGLACFTLQRCTLLAASAATNTFLVNPMDEQTSGSSYPDENEISFSNCPF